MAMTLLMFSEQTHTLPPTNTSPHPDPMTSLHWDDKYHSMLPKGHVISAVAYQHLAFGVCGVINKRAQIGMD